MKFLSNVKTKMAKNRAEVAASLAGITAMASQALCFEGALNKVLDLIWTLCIFTGIVMVAIGVVQLIRCAIALTGGDQLQPGQLGKAIGLIAAGLAACLLKTVLGSMGVPVTV